MAAMVGAVIAMLAGTAFLARPARQPGDITWGVTFSQKASRELGLDWRENYTAILRELKPRRVRLIAYWDLVEPQPGRYEFADLDRQMSEAAAAGARVLLVVGRKVPRWPETHVPEWVPRDEARQREELLIYLSRVAARYAGHPALAAWQVENEPFVQFGTTPPADAAFLAREVATVRALDRAHPVLLTDSGEWGSWTRAARLGDELGVTLYRRVYDPRIGTFTLPLSPGYYALKARWARRVLGRPERIVCVELGCEPWGARPLGSTSPGEQERLFPSEAFARELEFARRTGFDTFYLWGAEWWYRRKVDGDARYWEQARAALSGR